MERAPSRQSASLSLTVSVWDLGERPGTLYLAWRSKPLAHQVKFQAGVARPNFPKSAALRVDCRAFWGLRFGGAGQATNSQDEAAAVGLGRPVPCSVLPKSRPDLTARAGRQVGIPQRKTCNGRPATSRTPASGLP